MIDWIGSATNVKRMNIKTRALFMLLTKLQYNNTCHTQTMSCFFIVVLEPKQHTKQQYRRCTTIFRTIVMIATICCCYRNVLILILLYACDITLVLDATAICECVCLWHILLCYQISIGFVCFVIFASVDVCCLFIRHFSII